MKRGSMRFSNNDPKATIITLSPGCEDRLIRKIPGVQSGPRRKLVKRLLKTDHCVFRWINTRKATTNFHANFFWLSLEDLRDLIGTDIKKWKNKVAVKFGGEILWFDASISLVLPVTEWFHDVFFRFVEPHKKQRRESLIAMNVWNIFSNVFVLLSWERDQRRANKIEKYACHIFEQVCDYENSTNAKSKVEPWSNSFR